MVDKATTPPHVPQAPDGAGAPEIEITSEMIEAGVAELWTWDDGWEDDGEALKRILRAVFHPQPLVFHKSRKAKANAVNELGGSLQLANMNPLVDDS